MLPEHHFLIESLWFWQFWVHRQHVFYLPVEGRSSVLENQFSSPVRILMGKSDCRLPSLDLQLTWWMACFDPTFFGRGKNLPYIPVGLESKGSLYSYGTQESLRFWQLVESGWWLIGKFVQLPSPEAKYVDTACNAIKRFWYYFSNVHTLLHMASFPLYYSSSQRLTNRFSPTFFTGSFWAEFLLQNCHHLFFLWNCLQRKLWYF